MIPSAPRGRSLLWRSLAFVGVVALVGLLFWGLTSKGPNDTIDERLADGDSVAAPPFDLAVLSEGEASSVSGAPLRAAMSDGRLALEELRGSPFVLNLWASWCDPCRTEAPVLENGWSTAAKSGVVFIGLNMQDLSPDGLGFIEEFGITYPNIRDPGDEVASSYGAIGIPETYFIDAEGNVVGHAKGALSAEELSAGLRSARTGKPIGVFSAGALREQR